MTAVYIPVPTVNLSNTGTCQMAAVQLVDGKAVAAV
jgi:hypothetical protein